MQSVCCSQHLLNLHPPPPSSSFPSIPRHFTPLKPPQKNLRWRYSGINHTKGRFRDTWVTSCLPNTDSPAQETRSLPDSATGSSGAVSISNFTPGNGVLRRERLDPYKGKSGAVSFCGLSHQTLEERKLINSPYDEGTRSFLWVLGPVALLSSLLVPQFFLGGVVDGFMQNDILAEFVVSFASEFIFYAGLATFLSTTDHVQRPYLEFSAKRWSLITGLRGYLSSAFFIMGFKVFAPSLAAYVVWPVIGLPALIAVAPYLLGCAAQYAFELHLQKRNSSCWPLLPIIFEMYRVYQLSKAAHFIETLMFSLKESPISPLVMERSGALVSMLLVLQILGVVCLWSLITFLLRLFPSRPVAENY